MFIRDCIVNAILQRELYYIIEDADWSILHDGMNITANLKRLSSTVTKCRHGITHSIIHYGSINTFINKKGPKLPHASNKIVVTWFHMLNDDYRAKFIQKASESVDLWHTSCLLTRDKLVAHGVPEEKVVVVPLGVDLRVFTPPRSDNERESVRRELGIPQERIVIGSFQKDGNGWGEGLDPKLIKGPDIFCDAVEKLAERYPIFVLLSGPARGYVKRRLEQAGVPYLHSYLKRADDLHVFYKALDLYIVSSREEGGPKAILESLASGVPLVTTRVGMAPDTLHDGTDAFIVDIADVDGIVERASQLIDDSGLRKRFAANGRETVKDFSWENVADRYYNQLYSRVM